MPADKWTHEECEDNRKEIYKDMNDVRTHLFEISGGIKVLKWILPMIIALLGLFINEKIDGIKDKIDAGHHEKITGDGDDDDQDTDANGSVAGDSGRVEGPLYMDDLDAFEKFGTLDPVLGGKAKACNPVHGADGSEGTAN